MKIKKISAVAMTAAVLAAAAPITSALPNPLSVTASAETATKYKAGDVFYYMYFNDIVSDENPGMDFFECTVKSDGTLKISGWSFLDCPVGDDFNSSFYQETLTIPSEIGGYTVSEIGLSDNTRNPLAAQKVVIPETI